MTLSPKWKKDQDEAIEISKEELNWKAVGSPSRRASFSIIHGGSPHVGRSSVSSDKQQWDSFGGFQWEGGGGGSSIFDKDNSSSSVLSVPMLSNVPLEPTFRPHRSFSFSMGQKDNAYYSNFLTPTMEEEEENSDAYLRSRSQSSNSEFGIMNNRRSSLGFISTTSSLLTMSSIQDKFKEINANLNNNCLFSASPKQQQQQRDDIVSKGVLLSKLPSHIPLFMIEFKSGRNDFYYYPSSTVELLSIGDLVIVEADRGKDLGKVVANTLNIDQVLLLLKQQSSNSNKTTTTDEQQTQDEPSSFVVKRICRQANNDEINMLLLKDQDEQRALSICLQKIKSRKLPMEVVDAEFQWDRRKLTFYFIAEKRIDFRELVRELFKVYKTRIWMCAVNPT